MSDPGTPPVSDAPPDAPNLRLWAIVDVVYAVALAGLVLAFVPWKWPAANCAILGYASAVAASAWPLWSGRRWGWRLAVVTSLIGLALAVLIVCGFVASWAYLRAVYDSFGTGASLVSLLLAATSFQILGLHAALRLHALLRRSVRTHFEGKPGSGKAGARAALLLALLPPAIGLAVHARFSLSPLPPVSSEVRARSMAVVRSVLAGAAVDSGDLDAVPRGPAPIGVKLFSQGRLVARAHGDGDSLGAALMAAAQALKAHPQTAANLHGRIAIERAVATGPVPAWPQFLAALAFDPGRETVRVAGSAGAEQTIPTDELIRSDVYGVAPLLPFLGEVRLGVNPAWLRVRLGMGANASLERVRYEGWIECANGRVCPLLRGTTALPAGVDVDLRAAAGAAGAYMVQHQRPDGSFDYEYRPHTDRSSQNGYNMPRHAGTAYSLAGLYGLLRTPVFAAASAQALAWLHDRTLYPCSAIKDFACLVDAGNARLGQNALAAMAFIEYRRQTGSHQHDRIIHGLVAFIAHMQKPNGDFHHLFAPTVDAIATNRAPGMFESEEAALALVMAGQELGDDTYTRAAERALDYLTGEKYDHFLGRFTYGVDSWTCMAANRAWPELRHRRYLDFCLGYADFLRRLQYREGNAPSPDFVGHYGFSNVLIPQAPAAAGFSEALAAVAELARHHGRPDQNLERELLSALSALARDQIRDDNDFMMPDPHRAHGGIRRSLVQSEIRIDFVQHAASAFAHGARLGLGQKPKDS